MKKTIFALPCMAAISLAAFVGMRTLERNKNINETLLMANVEALTSEEGGGEFPRYINVTKKDRITEFKTEIKTDSSGFNLEIKFKRKCIVYTTFCEHSGNNDDICYFALNGTTSAGCDKWEEE